MALKNLCDHYITIIFWQLGNLEALVQIIIIQNQDLIGGYYNNVINARQRDSDQAKYLWTGMAIKYRKQVDVDLQYQIKLF